MTKQENPGSLEEVELLEFRYFNEIYWNLTNEKDKLIELLTTKERIREEWEHIFNASSKEKTTSGLARGAERVLASLFPTTWLPNSAPIGSDLMFETVDAIVHVDVKTMVESQMEKGKISVGLNQTSYFENDRFGVRGNLPNYYKLAQDTGSITKFCLTYFIVVIHTEKTDRYRAGEILRVDLICMPNGRLHTHYGNKIIGAGKSKNNSMRYIYRNQYFEKITSHTGATERAKLVYYNKSFAEDRDEIIEPRP